MAWNEPGGGNKDPWSGKGGDQGPPELDEVVRKLQEKLSGLFDKGRGRRSGGDSGGPGGGVGLPGGGSISLGIIGGILFAVWLGSGIYIIEPAERGVVLQFGAYKEVTQPGPHWRLPLPIEQHTKVNVDQVSSFRHSAQMLTRDENIVDFEVTVQYRVQDPADFLFQDQNPEKTLKDATETMVREIIGKSKLDFILTEGRGRVSTEIQEGVQGLIDQYKTGLQITSINMQPAKPPEQVKSAFDDAIKAREDKERLENQAQAYSNQVLPQARGEGARIIADAMAYRDKSIAEAEGESARFVAVLRQYLKAPEVTRQRLYLETLETVFTQSRKVLVDVKNSGNLMYLPLDKILAAPNPDEASERTAAAEPRVQPDTSQQPAARDADRGRRTR